MEVLVAYWYCYLITEAYLQVNYTLCAIKRDTLFSIRPIIPAFLSRFYTFMYQWKQE